MSSPEPGAVVLDASALLALVRRESGAEEVARALGSARMSVINWAEVMDVALRESIDPDIVRALFSAGLEVVPLTTTQAELAAGIRYNVRPLGLSLADCCCLALAYDEARPVLTADSDWMSSSLDLDIRLIR
jgi:ribonuclease VapC